MKNLFINMLKFLNKKRKKRHNKKNSKQKKNVLKNEMKNNDIEKFSHVKIFFFVVDIFTQLKKLIF